MCGIVGAIAKRNVVPILLEGLKRLEYRGYDSAGVAVLNGHLQRVRSTGRVAELEKLTQAQGLSGTIGIAHTRWATHGVPSGAQRASARLRRRVGGAQRHHREPRGDARRAPRPGLRVHLRHRHRGHRAPGAFEPAGGCGLVRRSSKQRRRAGRRLCHRGGERILSIAPGGRAAWARRCCSAWARARISPPRTPRRCCRSRSAWSILRTAICAEITLVGRAHQSTPTGQRRRAPGARLAAHRRRGRARAPTATTCRRKSSSSRWRSPTRSKWSPTRGRFRRSCSAPKPNASCATSTRC